jgi:hypothetical protein
MYVFVYVAMLLCLIGIYDQQVCGGLGNAVEKGNLKENMNRKGVLTFHSIHWVRSISRTLDHQVELL